MRSLLRFALSVTTNTWSLISRSCVSSLSMFASCLSRDTMLDSCPAARVVEAVPGAGDTEAGGGDGAALKAAIGSRNGFAGG